MPTYAKKSFSLMWLRKYIVRDIFSRNVLSAHLSEVSGMVLVEVDPVVMLTTSVSTTSRMLPVLSNTSMTMGNVASKLSGLLFVLTHLEIINK